MSYKPYIMFNRNVYKLLKMLLASPQTSDELLSAFGKKHLAIIIVELSKMQLIKTTYIMLDNKYESLYEITDEGEKFVKNAPKRWLLLYASIIVLLVIFFHSILS